MKAGIFQFSSMMLEWEFRKRKIVFLSVNCGSSFVSQAPSLPIHKYIFNLYLVTVSFLI